MQCDVCIIGAGPAGLAASISLAESGFSVILLERNNFDKRLIGEHVPPEIKPILSKLGYVPKASRHLSSPGVVSCWSAGKESQRDYVFNPFGAGFNLSRPVFEADLSQVAKQAGVRLITSAKVQCRQNTSTWKFVLRCHGETFDISSKFAVDASGRQAWLLRQLGINRKPISSEIAAIAYLQRSCNDSDNRLVVERGSDGWWYSLSLQNRMRAIAFVTSPNFWPRDRILREEYWLDQLSTTDFVRKFLKEPLCTRLITCPAGIMAAEKVIGENWIAIGDAAATFDPLAGRGILKALQDGSLLPKILKANKVELIDNLTFFQNRVNRELQEHIELRRNYYSEHYRQ